MKLDKDTQKAIEERQNERYEEIKDKSAKVSKLTLTMNMAGIANVWLSLNYDLLVGKEIWLFVALLLFVLSLFCEYIHYVISVILNHIYASYRGIIKVEKDEVVIADLPDFAVNLTWIFWSIKILLTISGYIILGYVVALCVLFK
ncbi:MAG: hypothetical protein UFP03_06540 [Paludibacteraceae bacterium]|nr:hypothetical protein [Paludibacteraceae bacterium]